MEKSQLWNPPRAACDRLATGVFCSCGSIPILEDIYDMMEIPVVMLSYGLNSDGLHSPTEHYSIEMVHRGIETAIVYMDEPAQLPRKKVRK